MKYLIDTNICIYILNNRVEGSAQWIKNAGLENVCVSSITVAELEFGLAKSEKYDETQSAIYKFLSGFNIIDFDLNAAQSYGRLRAELQRQGKPIGAMDMLLAATALAKGMTLVTNNEKEFARLNNLKVQNWVTAPP